MLTICRYLNKFSTIGFIIFCAFVFYASEMTVCWVTGFANGLKKTATTCTINSSGFCLYAIWIKMSHLSVQKFYLSFMMNMFAMFVYCAIILTTVICNWRILMIYFWADSVGYFCNVIVLWCLCSISLLLLLGILQWPLVLQGLASGELHSFSTIVLISHTIFVYDVKTTNYAIDYLACPALLSCW